MAQFPHDSIKPFSDTGGKKEQVSDMFNRIARRYDFMNRFLSAGIDVRWRIKAINHLRNDQPQVLLDVATGTADMALRAAKTLQPKKIIGIDISPGMLALGRQKIAAEKLEAVIELQDGDSENLAFADARFDAVMVAFGVRNFEHLEQGLKEIYRVLKPGAPLVVLEFSKPKWALVRAAYHFYMSRVSPAIARLFGQNAKAYQYLNASAQAFPDREQFTAVLNKAGFEQSRFEPLTLGICCLYSARKPR